MTSAEIYAYAERNTVFLSDHGVCAGPRSLIEEFLHVLVDGKPIEGAESLALDTPVQAALAEIEPACEYGLLALQAFAVVFSLWPTMNRTYECLMTLVNAWSGEESEMFKAFRQRLQRSVGFLRTATRLGTEAQRVSHEQVYADMYAQCTNTLGTPALGMTLRQRIAPVDTAHHASAADQLRAIWRQRFCKNTSAHSPEIASAWSPPLWPTCARSRQSCG